MLAGITPVKTFESTTPGGVVRFAVRVLRPGYVSGRAGVHNPGPELMIEFYDTRVASDDRLLGRFVHRCMVSDLPGPGHLLVLTDYRPTLYIDAVALDAVRTWVETQTQF